MSSEDDEAEVIDMAERLVWQQWRIERILQDVGWPDRDHAQLWRGEWRAPDHAHVTTLAAHPRCVVCNLDMEDW